MLDIGVFTDLKHRQGLPVAGCAGCSCASFASCVESVRSAVRTQQLIAETFIPARDHTLRQEKDAPCLPGIACSLEVRTFPHTSSSIQLIYCWRIHQGGYSRRQPSANCKGLLLWTRGTLAQQEYNLTRLILPQHAAHPRLHHLRQMAPTPNPTTQLPPLQP